jgi:hypothetical protein
VLKAAFSVLFGIVPLLIALALWRRVSRARPVPRRFVVVVAVGGALSGLIAFFAEQFVLQWTGLSLRVTAEGSAGALLALFLFVAPLEEGLKVLVVWWLYSERRIVSPRYGMTYAVCTAAGFAASKSILLVASEPYSGLWLLRVLLAIPAQLFFAGVWGYALGGGRGARGGWFSTAWLLAMLLHGIYIHIAFGRGPGVLPALTPLLLFMGVATWLALRDLAPESQAALSSERWLPTRAPTLREMRQALRVDQPLKLRWVPMGALVNLGVMLTLLALAVYIGHQLDIDFALADEADVRSSGPLVLLGAAIVLAFPISGYLIARASGVKGVLEPALASGVAMIGLLLLVSMAQPIAVVFAVAVAPVALGLACGGAWFGLDR